MVPSENPETEAEGDFRRLKWISKKNSTENSRTLGVYRGAQGHPGWTLHAVLKNFVPTRLSHAVSTPSAASSGGRLMYAIATGAESVGE